MNNKQIKYTIASMLFIGTISILSTLHVKNANHIELVLESVLTNNICATKFLLEQGADVNEKYKHNHTLLHSASLYGDLEMVKLLVESGAKLSKNDFGLSAFDSASESASESADVMKYLSSVNIGFDRILDIKNDGE